MRADREEILLKRGLLPSTADASRCAAQSQLRPTKRRRPRPSRVPFRTSTGEIEHGEQQRRPSLASHLPNDIQLSSEPVSLDVEADAAPARRSPCALSFPTREASTLPDTPASTSSRFSSHSSTTTVQPQLALAPGPPPCDPSSLELAFRLRTSRSAYQCFRRRPETPRRPRPFRFFFGQRVSPPFQPASSSPVAFARVSLRCDPRAQELIRCRRACS